MHEKECNILCEKPSMQCCIHMEVVKTMFDFPEKFMHMFCFLFFWRQPLPCYRYKMFGLPHSLLWYLPQKHLSASFYHLEPIWIWPQSAQTNSSWSILIVMVSYKTYAKSESPKSTYSTIFVSRFKAHCMREREEKIGTCWEANGLSIEEWQLSERRPDFFSWWKDLDAQELVMNPSCTVMSLRCNGQYLNFILVCILYWDMARTRFYIQPIYSCFLPPVNLWLR